LERWGCSPKEEAFKAVLDLNLAIVLPPAGTLNWRPPEGPSTTPMNPCGKDLENLSGGARVAKSHENLTAGGCLGAVLTEVDRMVTNLGCWKSGCSY